MSAGNKIVLDATLSTDRDNLDGELKVIKDRLDRTRFRTPCPKFVILGLRTLVDVTKIVNHHSKAETISN